MTFEDAKKKAAEHGYWFRPVTWEGHGRALREEGDVLCLEPYSRDLPWEGTPESEGPDWSVEQPECVRAESYAVRGCSVQHI